MHGFFSPFRVEILSLNLPNRSLRKLLSSTAAVWSIALLVVVGACGSEPLPAASRPDYVQPTFARIAVTPAPENPTPTPWPNLSDEGVRQIPDGLDPRFYSRADSDEVVAMWTQMLSGAKFEATSGRFFFRRRPRFEGTMHLCPGGTGYLDGDPEGAAKWEINASAGGWHEVTLTHEIPFTGDSVTFALGLHEGQPARSGSDNIIEFTDSDRCLLAEPVTLPRFTAAERLLEETPVPEVVEIEEIPWVDGEREFPDELMADSQIDQETGLKFWEAYLTGAQLEAVAYNYTSFSVTPAFEGVLHLCSERAAVLDGDMVGVAEWAIQPTGSGHSDAKVVFTLPDDPTFRTIVLAVSNDEPVRMGRIESTGLIGPSPLEISESTECG